MKFSALNVDPARYVMTKEKSIVGQAEDWRHADACAAGRHGRYPIQDGALPAPSPRLRGEGRGEGAFPQARTRGEAPSPSLASLGRPLPASGARYRRCRVGFTGTRSNSLFRRTNSLFRRKRFPVPGKQGIAPQHTGIAARMDLDNRRIGRKFAKFPDIFPVVRESGHKTGPISARRLM